MVTKSCRPQALTLWGLVLAASSLAGLGLWLFRQEVVLNPDLGHLTYQWRWGRQAKMTVDRSGQRSASPGGGSAWGHEAALEELGSPALLAASSPTPAACETRFWAPRYQVVPVQHKGISVAIRSPAPRRLARRLVGNGIAFFAGGFEDGVLPDWSEQSPFRCSRLVDDEGKRWKSIAKLLDEASESGAAIVVLPELTVDPEMLRRLREWLKGNRRSHGVSMVVAGSFHVEGEAAAEGRSPRRNVAWVLDAYGDEILRHVKLRPLRTEASGAFREEDIEGSARVELLHLDFGLLGVAICLDFCEESRVPVKDIWSEVEPALMLVPSMGEETTLSAHQRKAEMLARQCGAVTVVASQHPKKPEGVGLRWDANRSKPDRGSPSFRGHITWPTRTFH